VDHKGIVCHIKSVVYVQPSGRGISAARGDEHCYDDKLKWCVKSEFWGLDPSNAFDTICGKGSLFLVTVVIPICSSVEIGAWSALDTTR
jgi:hypothetical protein